MDVAFLSGKYFNDHSSCYHLTVPLFGVYAFLAERRLGVEKEPLFQGAKLSISRGGLEVMTES